MSLPEDPSERTNTEADAAAAAFAVGEFWSALNLDDDALLMVVTSVDIHEGVGTESGMCGRVRDQLGGIESETAGRVGVSSKVRVVKGWMVYVCMVVPDGQPMTVGTWGPERRRGWALWVDFEAGRWVVAGTFDQSPEGWPPGTEYLDLPGAPAPRGGIN